MYIYIYISIRIKSNCRFIIFLIHRIVVVDLQQQYYVLTRCWQATAIPIRPRLSHPEETTNHSVSIGRDDIGGCLGGVARL